MSQRKLNQEIDKLLKKVKDGLQDFDQVYDNFQESEPSQQSYREKLEGDLKGIIKKLQKQREQIKSWLSKDDVKDREQSLLDNRRLIENGMERFKSVEKLMKLKQFSTQALSNPNIVMNPKEIKKLETTTFIEECIEELRKQLETLEANDDHEKIERHTFHIANLENILRLINRDVLECETVEEYKEDISYYVENNLEDPDFVEYEDIYADMGCEIQPNDFDNTDISFNGIDSTPKKERHNINNNNKLNGNGGSIIDSSSAISSAVPSRSPTPGIQMERQVSSKNGITKSLQNGDSEDTKKVSNDLDKKQKDTSTTKSQTPEKKKEEEKEEEKEKEKESKEETKTRDLLAELKEQKQKKLKEVDDILTEDLKKPAFNNPLFTPGLKEWLSTKKSLMAPSDILTEEMSKQLEFSLLNCPDSLDSEVPKLHQVNLSQPHPTSIFFPQEPIKFYYLPHFSNNTTGNVERLHANWRKNDLYSRTSLAQIFTKFDLDTLFFIFYHYQGTYEQFIASRELTLRKWLFNKIDRFWYQKQREPVFPSSANASRTNLESSEALNGDAKTTTQDEKLVEKEEETVETWRYFDYKSSWITRRVGADFVYNSDHFEKL
ncbi:hypothetical protein ACO0QE_004448 [Hanseniaspora vineae]